MTIRAIVTATLLPIFFAWASSVGAGTNTWTFSSGPGDTCSPKATWAEVLACIPTSTGICSPSVVTSTDTSDVTGEYIWTATVERWCNIAVSTFRFTNACVAPQTFDPAIGGCAAPYQYQPQRHSANG